MPLELAIASRDDFYRVGAVSLIKKAEESRAMRSARRGLRLEPADHFPELVGWVEFLGIRYGVRQRSAMTVCEKEWGK